MKARLSMAFQDLRGKDGNVIIMASRNGLVLTPNVTRKKPRTMPQRAIRSYFRKSAKAFEAMTVPQAQAWESYAQTITIVDPITGKSYHPSAINAFVQLGVKFLQLNPSGTLPLTPPSTDFVGDSISISASVEVSGYITFSASGANTISVTTELLIQKLASPHRKPSQIAYRHAAWKAFTGGSLSIDVPVRPGWYSVGYRFVKASTGQATPLIALPMQQVFLATESTETQLPHRQKKAA
jgi:hypothetical protein